MQDVRIEPQAGGRIHLVQVTCGCGNNVLRNATEQARAFNHQTELGGIDVSLCCDNCGNTFLIRSQRNHFHVIQTESGEKYPPISPGTRVRTTQENPRLRDEWTEMARTKRRWGVEGTVLVHHDSHGLHYDVRHQDGTEGPYDPSELEVVNKG